MRLIDADKLRKDVLDLPNCYNGFSDTYDKARVLDLVDEQPTVDAVPRDYIEEWKKGKSGIEQMVADKIIVDWKWSLSEEDRKKYGID